MCLLFYILLCWVAFLAVSLIINAVIFLLTADRLIQGGMIELLAMRKGDQEALVTALGGVLHLPVWTAAQHQMARATHQGSKLKSMVHITVWEATAWVPPVLAAQPPTEWALAPGSDGERCAPPSTWINIVASSLGPNSYVGRLC